MSPIKKVLVPSTKLYCFRFTLKVPLKTLFLKVNGIVAFLLLPLIVKSPVTAYPFAVFTIEVDLKQILGYLLHKKSLYLLNVQFGLRHLTIQSLHQYKH